MLNRNPRISNEETSLMSLEDLEILNYAENSGADMDGDIITIDGINYYVNVFRKLVERV